MSILKRLFGIGESPKTTAGLQKPDDPSDGAWEVLHALLGLYPGSHSVTFLITPDGDQKPHEVTAIKSLLKEKPDAVFNRDHDGWTPLHYAVKWSNKHAAEVLLVNKAEADAKDNKGQTPLNGATFTGRTDIAELLLAYKANVNTQNNKGWTPFTLCRVQWEQSHGGVLAGARSQYRSQVQLWWMDAFAPRSKRRAHGACGASASSRGRGRGQGQRQQYPFGFGS